MPPNTEVGKRILVTRTQPGASQLAEAIEAAGYVAVVEPLIEIVASSADPPELAQLDRYDAVVWLSVHAVTHAFEIIHRRWPVLPTGLTWIAVGASTRAALEQQGVAALSPADERSEGILDMPELKPFSRKRILLVAGVGGRRLLDEALVAGGARVDRIALYRRREVAAASRIDLTRFDYVVISSVAAAEALIRRADEVAKAKAVMVVPSVRVAESLTAAGLSRIVVAAGADAAATLSAIDSCEGRNE